jgi:hypothetical protein
MYGGDHNVMWTGDDLRFLKGGSLMTLLQYLERDKTIVAELAQAVLAVKQGPQDPARRIELHRTLNRLTTCQLALLRSMADADRFTRAWIETPQCHNRP